MNPASHSNSLLTREGMASRERTLLKKSLFGFAGLFIAFAFIQIVFVRPSVESALEKSTPAALNEELAAGSLPVRIGEPAGTEDSVAIAFKGNGRTAVLTGKVRSPAVRDTLMTTLQKAIDSNHDSSSPLAGVKGVENEIGLSPPSLEPFLSVKVGGADFPAEFDPVEFVRRSPHTDPVELLPAKPQAILASRIQVSGLLPGDDEKRQVVDALNETAISEISSTHLTSDYECKPAPWTNAAAGLLKDDLQTFPGYHLFLSEKHIRISGQSPSAEASAGCESKWRALAAENGFMPLVTVEFTPLPSKAPSTVEIGATAGTLQFTGTLSNSQEGEVANLVKKLNGGGIETTSEIAFDANSARLPLSPDLHDWAKALASHSNAATLKVSESGISIDAQARDSDAEKKLKAALEPGTSGSKPPGLKVTLPPEEALEVRLNGAQILLSGVVHDEPTKLRFERLAAGYPNFESSIQIDPHALTTPWNESFDKSIRMFLRHAWDGKVSLEGKTINLAGKVLYDGEQRELETAFANLREEHGFETEGSFSTGEPGIDSDLRSLLDAATSYFAAGKSTLDASQRAAIDKAGDELGNYPELRVVVAGHADSSGDPQKNWELSRLRAEAVGAILQRAGVESGRIALKVFGDSRAAADESTEEGRRLNRRVEIKVK